MSIFIKKIRVHLFGLILISSIIIIAALYMAPKQQSIQPPELYSELNFMDFNDTFQRALLLDMLRLYRPQAENDSLYQALLHYNQVETDAFSSKNRGKVPFTGAKLLHLLLMYLNFTVIYFLVLLLTYYGVQTLALLMFIRKQQGRPPFLKAIVTQIRFLKKTSERNDKRATARALLKTGAKGSMMTIVYAALFSPAYVTAYAIKSDFNTSSEVFLVLLAVISNGLLITYANKFFTLLIAESRKGYVLTARVKNLKDNWFFKEANGIPLKSIFALRKNFKGHLLQHIFINARYQYFETIKEQASFLISGLVIIEMALNIHGHFTYELMQQVLYKNYHYALLMSLGIFILVKATDIFAEILKQKNNLF